MAQRSETQTTAIKIRQKRSIGPVEQLTSVEDVKKKHFRADQLLKNTGMAAALVLCAVTLRTGAFPTLDPAADFVLAAATDNSLLDDQLGKLSFVSALFPEAVLVFGEQSAVSLVPPTEMEQVTHAWSEREPYIAWEASGGVVSAAADGEVVGVYHGNGDEQIVKVTSADGVTCIYGNLKRVNVRMGDAVCAGDMVGSLLPGADFVFEVQRNGISIDPTAYLPR